MDRWIQLLIDIVEIIILVVIMVNLIPILVVHPIWTLLSIFTIALFVKKK